MANEFIVRKGLIVEGASGGTVVDIQGSQGQLFSVTDDLSGSIFAVSDISGVPIFDVNSSGVSYFDGNVGIGTAAPGAPLQVNRSSNGINQYIYNTTSGQAYIAFGNATTGLFSQDFTSANGLLVGIDQDETAIIWNAEATRLRFGTSGTEKMSIAAGGNVGIGTTNPQSKLHIETGSGGTYNPNTNHDDVTIEGSGNIGLQLFSPASSYQYIAFGDPDSVNAGYLRYYHGTNEMVFRTNGGDRMVIDSSGEVGIGTTSPGAKLDVVVSNVSVTPNGDSSGVFRNNGHNYISILSGDTSEGGIIFGNSADAADGYIAYKHGTGAADQAFAFGTANSERMRIDSAGNVGIGTTNPSQKLNVDGGASGLNQGIPQTSGATQNGILRLTSGSATYGETLDFGMNVGPTYAWIQATNKAGLGTNYSLSLNPNGGNVGIGTTAPTHKLHVNGDMRLTGALRDSNNAKGSAGQVLSSTGSATDWIPLPATATVYTPKVYNLNNSTNINSQGQKLAPDFGTLEIEGNTTVEQVSGSDTDFQVSGEGVGIYEVTYAVFYKNTGNQRTPLGTYLTLNGTAVNGSLMVNYLRANVAGGGNWSSCTNTFYVDVTDASHPMALCVRRADSSTAPSGISMVEPAGMAVKSTISFRRIS